LIAIAHSVGITLTIDDFARISDATPFLADLKPSGKYVMEDLSKIGGVPSAYLSVSFWKDTMDHIQRSFITC